jgi:aryl-alcohol dehydrogenase-like predicted oxidoreductase
MVGFCLLNPSARIIIFPLTLKSGVGVLNMFAVRRALSQPTRLKEICVELVEKDAIAKSALDLNDPLGFLLKETDAATLPEAAYRYCRHEQGVDVVLTGTGNPDHLKENIAAILKPLPQAAFLRACSALDTLTELAASRSSEGLTLPIGMGEGKIRSRSFTLRTTALE